MLKPSLFALALALTGCAAGIQPGAVFGVPSAGQAQAQGTEAAPAVRVALGGQVPAELMSRLLPEAQATADEASRRRQIDYFHLHAAPVGVSIGELGWVVSLLGTSKERTDLNLELRALASTVPAVGVGFNFNYSGPVTQARDALGGAQTAPAPTSRSRGPRFELMPGLPGNGVAEAYGDMLEHLGERLTTRFNARDAVRLDDGPLVYALMESASEPAAYVFCNQGSKLVLGERKYADVQAVHVVGPDARVLGGYTIVAFNPKTASPTASPQWQPEALGPFGTLVVAGER